MAKKALILLGVIFLLANRVSADPENNIPPFPCDFYGTARSDGALPAGAVITAQDPDGLTIGSFTVAVDGRYGFLSCLADDPNLDGDQGAVDGDILTFYIDGVPQQHQGIWRAGEVLQLDLGIPTDDGAFNIHLDQMPGYTSYADDPNYSGVAVADMILDYLDPVNTDTQADLMLYADTNENDETSGPEIKRLLNNKAPGRYHFVLPSNSLDQNSCLRQICHWMAYEVPGVPEDRRNVPIAVCNSADSAQSSDSDYRHWMSVVGVKTNQDPYPLGPYSSPIPDSLELLGVYLNDPGYSGLGFHTYMAAEEWTANHFRPIASSLEAAGSYIAILEPPEDEPLPVEIVPAEANQDLQIVLGDPAQGVSIFIPGWVDQETKDYLASLLTQLEGSADFATLSADACFGQALQDSQVNRCFKVDGKIHGDYTIIPFEKEIDGRLVTTTAIIINNETGQFRMAAVDKAASTIFTPISLMSSYQALRQEIGWQGGEYPVDLWLSNLEGSALFPGWSLVTATYNQQGPAHILNTTTYAVTSQGQLQQESVSPPVEVLDAQAYQTGDLFIKLVLFTVTSPAEYTVSLDEGNDSRESNIYDNGDRWLLVLKDSQDFDCRIKVEAAGGDITYIYLR